MGLNYDKAKAADSETSWASYSDLFMVLSVMFLLLYVVTSLRVSTHTIEKNNNEEQLARKNEDLQQQLKAYETLKGDYLEKQASQKEQDQYEELMSKLSLLKEQQKQERENMYMQIEESKDKEAALNQYQQIIRNIINANMVAKSRINKRDQVISGKDIKVEKQKELLAEKSEDLKKTRGEIAALREDVKDREAKLDDKAEMIASIENKMAAKIQLIEQLNQEKKTTAAQAEAEKARIREQGKQEIAKLESESLEMQKELSSKMEELSKSLQAKDIAIAEEKESKEQIQKELGLKMANLNKTIQEKEAKIEEEKKLQAELKQLADTLSEEKGKLAADLAKAQELLAAKESIINELRNNFEKGNIKARVDGETGEVIIEFGDEYFDTDKYALKAGMKKVLQKFVPTYVKSIFNDPEAAKNIKNVEIVGFASPTYQGKFIDPQSLDLKDQAAVNYNLQLSFQRAKSIFNYIFDKQVMQFDGQKKLLPLIKVTGRSYLAEEIKGRNLASGMSQRQFCKKYNCKKSQRVIIKFNLE